MLTAANIKTIHLTVLGNREILWQNMKLESGPRQKY
jgi:hypothetical protein